LTSVLLVAVFGLLGAFVPVPYVALGPGPTYNTLGSVHGTPVIQVAGHQTYPTRGNLNMTTVSVTDQVTLFGALALWASGQYALSPRDLYFPPNESAQQVQQSDSQQFNDSESSAESAALSYLGYPTKVVVGQVLKGTPAEGLLVPGDRLFSANGHPVTDPAALQAALAHTTPGMLVPIVFQHGNQPVRTVTVRLMRHPQNQPEGFLGVAATQQPDVPFHVAVSLANVGGPSAGLMFALGIIDKLTPGQLNGGKFVAGTGELDNQGHVLPIGGIQFKMAAARAQGATIFLVPAQNCTEAKANAPDGLRLVRVTSVADAVVALRDLDAGKSPAGC
jgi:PDZ domain-containing protein